MDREGRLEQSNIIGESQVLHGWGSNVLELNHTSQESGSIDERNVAPKAADPWTETDDDRDEQRNASDTAETQSHFSDSSSEDEEESGAGQETWVEAALRYLPQNAVLNGALLPFSGTEGSDGEIYRNDASCLSRGPSPGVKKLSLYAHSHGMPSLLKADGDPSSTSQRFRIQRNLARGERDKALQRQDEYKAAYQQTSTEKDQLESDWKQAVEERNLLTSDLKKTVEERDRNEEEKDDWFNHSRRIEERLALATTERNSWKTAFERQRPFAMAERERRARREQGLEDMEDAETQTDVIETASSSMQTEPMTATADAEAQTNLAVTELGCLEVANHDLESRIRQLQTTSANSHTLVQDLEGKLAESNATLKAMVEQNGNLKFQIDQLQAALLEYYDQVRNYVQAELADPQPVEHNPSPASTPVSGPTVVDPRLVILYEWPPVKNCELYLWRFMLLLILAMWIPPVYQPWAYRGFELSHYSLIP